MTRTFVLVIAAIVVAAAGNPFPAAGVSASSTKTVTLSGAGSTFDAPFFNTAFSAYGATHNVTVTYQAVGSGAGIQQFSAGTVDFGASDVPMNSTELSAAQKKGGVVQQIPVTLGGVAVAYNVSGVKMGLRLSGPVLADIFLGKITKWNTPAIAALNPGIKLPNFGITVVHRADSSGTSYIFTSYLSAVSHTWKSQVGAGKLVNWPVGSLGQGNDGVAALIQEIPGAIGYLELTYVLKYHVTTARLKNRAGQFVLPSQQGVAAAAAAIPRVNPTHFSIVNAPGSQSYPICGYSWALLYRNQPDSTKGKALVKLFNWMLTTGQKYARSLDYVPLPKPTVKVGLSYVKAIKV